MDQARSVSGNNGGGDDNVGIPDDLRCKRSDGKQWRCTAMSMPDKTVCEKHYIQAKKRAANSAMRANLKKAKRKSSGGGADDDAYLESKSDDFDLPLSAMKLGGGEHNSGGGSRLLEKVSKNQFRYVPEGKKGASTAAARGTPQRPDEDDSQEEEEDADAPLYEENWAGYDSPEPASGGDSSRKRRSLDATNATTEYSDGSSESSGDTGGQTCHQCRRNNRDRVTWCQQCDRRGYCDNCISTWYSNISLDEIQRTCPACRGICNCKVCLRSDNSIKVRIREIPVLDKLQYLHLLMSSVLPVVKQIHREQCSEVELEKKLRGGEIDLTRIKLSADEQMCCNLCRIPITDYHRRCPSCSYDLCLNCCRDLREATSHNKEPQTEQEKAYDRNVLSKFPHWRSNDNGRISCPPKEYGGCGYSSVNLSRIFKMNWVAKLVKNAEEMVSGCVINNADSPPETELNALRLCQCSHRESSDDNYLYCPASEDLKTDGIGNFRKHWKTGEPIIVKQVFDRSSISSWDPMVIWRGILETTDEKMKDENRMVRAIDCFDGSEIDIELSHFMSGYSEGRNHDNGWPQLLKLKDWPSPSASEEFLLYQRPEFISKLPLLQYIHSKWGLLNVAAKLPHYSLQNDVGPKIYISYGINDELGRGDSVTNLHFNMRDMVYLLVHTSEVKLKDWQRTKIEMIHKSFKESEVKEAPGEPQVCSSGSSPGSAFGAENNGLDLHSNQSKLIMDQGFENHSSSEGNMVNHELPFKQNGDVSEKTHPGVLWDVFRRLDVPKLNEYIKMHWKEFGKQDDILNEFVTWPLYDGAIFLDRHHKKRLKEEFGVEPWSFEQNLGEAIFVPAGCPFQARNVQSTVQLGLDFLSPESLGEAVRLAEEVRCLPNDHEAKLQVLEVGKISLYAASSSIKEVQKLVLDPKLGAEIGYGDPNLTGMVSENYEKMVKRRQITCA